MSSGVDFDWNPEEVMSSPVQEFPVADNVDDNGLVLNGLQNSDNSHQSTAQDDGCDQANLHDLVGNESSKYQTKQCTSKKKVLPPEDVGYGYAKKYQVKIEELIQKISFHENSWESNSTQGQEQNDPGKDKSDGMGEKDYVYINFDMEKRDSTQESLRVFQHKDQILDAISKHQVVIIEGPTGCGKTTQIPQYILDQLARNEKRGNIVVTQPRRIAAQSVTMRVCKERDWNIGDLVGYQIGLSRRTTYNTRLTFMTTGVLLQKLISVKSLRDYSHIIVDEIHERSLETDLLLLLIKKLLLQNADRTTKVILMSATMNSSKLKDYFPKWMKECNMREESLLIQMKEKPPYCVQEFCLDELNNLFGKEFVNMAELKLSEFKENKLSIDPSLYTLVVRIIKELDILEAKFASQVPKCSRSRGGVLVFLPGLMDIYTIYDMLSEHAEIMTRDCGQNMVRWLLLPLHSSVTAEEQRRVFQNPPLGYRKIVLATNIAESSITLSDIVYVIDFCLTKSIHSDPLTNFSCLKMEWASQVQCLQRRGRVGRVADGKVFRLMPKAYYRQLENEAVPEMTKVPLENVILSIKSLNLGTPTSMMALALDPPRLSDIRLAICNLKEVAALTIFQDLLYTPYDGDLTRIGQIMAKLPLGIRLSRLVVLGYVFGVLEESIIIACGLSVKSPFSFPFSKRLMAYMSKLTWANGSFSDFFALIYVFRNWAHKSSSGEFNDVEVTNAWKTSYFVQINALRQLNLAIEDVTRRLQSVNVEVNLNHLRNGTISSQQSLILQIVLAGAFYPNYFVSKRPPNEDYFNTIAKELDSCDPMNSLYYTSFPSFQPGGLYASHIKDKFDSRNSIPYIRFDCGKVIVEFDDRGDKVGPFDTNLFRGLRSRLLGDPVRFGVLEPSASQRLWVQRSEASCRNLHVKCPPLRPLPKITENNGIIACITKIFSPDKFFIVYYEDMEKLKEWCQRFRNASARLIPMAKDSLIPGSLCVIEHDHDYYRGRVDFVWAENNRVMVFLVDIGVSFWKNPNQCLAYNTTILEDDMIQTPCLAVKCRIYGVKPLQHSRGWDDNAAALLMETYTTNEKLKTNRVVSVEVHSISNSVIACDIRKREQWNGRKRHGLRYHLFSSNLVSAKDESKNHSDNNRIRKMCNSTEIIPQLCEEELEYYNKEQQRPFVPPVFVTPPTKREGFQGKCELRGPFSPLELKFYSISAATYMRRVSIESSSINHVALDQDPSFPYSRLMVGAAVEVSHRTGSLILKETMLAPAVPGLLHLLLMLFCPVIEFRNNTKADMITGCLCGLGVDHATKEPILRERDIEEAFDFQFTRQDVNEVNVVRQNINLILSNPHLTQDETNELRGIIRENVKTLMQRRRTPIFPCFPQNEHQWTVPTRGRLLKHIKSGKLEEVCDLSQLLFQEILQLHHLDSTIL